MKNIILAATALLAVTACAQAPENIAAAAMPLDLYDDLSCSAVSVERAVVMANLGPLEATQRNAVASDALGVFLIGLPLASMTGGDVAAQIAVLRGQLAALDLRLARC